MKLAAISEDMVKDGYQNIMNIDISGVVVEAMTAKYKDIPQLKCENSFEFKKKMQCFISLEIHYIHDILVFFKQKSIKTLLCKAFLFLFPPRPKDGCSVNEGFQRWRV